MPCCRSALALSYKRKTGLARSRKASGAEMCCQLWYLQGFSFSAANQRQIVLTAILLTKPNPTSMAAISDRLHRLSALPSSLGLLQANAVACALTSGGKTPGRSRSGQIFQALGFCPALSPFIHGSLAASDFLADLLVAPFWMFVGQQNDLGSRYNSMWRCPCLAQLTQFVYFFFKELYRILVFRSWVHFSFPPEPQYNTISV